MPTEGGSLCGAELLEVVGAGYVGLVTSAALIELGRTVRCVERDASRVKLIRDGGMPFHESGVAELLRRGISSGRLEMVSTSELQTGCRPQRAAAAIICTNAAAGDGLAMEEVIRTAVERRPHLIVIKSTVAPHWLHSLHAICADLGVPLVLAPEFLAEGTALRDALTPARTVVGAYSSSHARWTADLFDPKHRSICVITDPATAVGIKLFSNAMLAARVSMANEFASLVRTYGGDLSALHQGVTTDPRIGPGHLTPGAGFGGPCLEKDLMIAEASFEVLGQDSGLLRSVRLQNMLHLARLEEEVARVTSSGSTIAFFGLAFKPGTSDTRGSLAVMLAARLRARGYRVRGYDELAARYHAAELDAASVELCSSVIDAATGSSCQVVFFEEPRANPADWTAAWGCCSAVAVFDMTGNHARSVAAVPGSRYVRWGGLALHDQLDGISERRSHGDSSSDRNP